MRKLFWFMLGAFTATVGWLLTWYFLTKPELVDSEIGDIDDDDDWDYVDPGLDDVSPNDADGAAEDEFED